MYDVKMLALPFGLGTSLCASENQGKRPQATLPQLEPLSGY